MIRNTWIFMRFIVAWLYTLLMSVVSCCLAITVGPSRMWLIMCRPWAQGTLWLVGVKLRIEGAEHLKGPAVFISNHQSLIDVVFMPAILPRSVRFVAKHTLLLIPFWGWAFALGGAVLINRGRPRQAFADIRRGLKRLPRGWSITVFPEGTRPIDGQMKRFKKGAFMIAMEAKLPIVPIGMDGARTIVPPDGWLVRGGDVRVTVGEPIDTSTWTIRTIDEHLRQGETAVAECVRRAAARRPEPAADGARLRSRTA